MTARQFTKEESSSSSSKNFPINLNFLSVKLVQTYYKCHKVRTCKYPIVSFHFFKILPSTTNLFCLRISEMTNVNRNYHVHHPIQNILLTIRTEMWLSVLNHWKIQCLFIIFFYFDLFFYLVPAHFTQHTKTTDFLRYQVDFLLVLWGYFPDFFATGREWLREVPTENEAQLPIQVNAGSCFLLLYSRETDDRSNFLLFQWSVNLLEKSGRILMWRFLHRLAHPKQ